MKYSWKHGIFEIEKFMLPTKTLLLSILLFLIFSDSVSVVVVLRVAFVFHSSPFSPRAPTSSICEVVRPSGLISNLYIFSGKKKILASGIQVSNSLCLGSTKAKIFFLPFSPIEAVVTLTAASCAAACLLTGTLGFRSNKLTFKLKLANSPM